ncbi:hypothetical protein HMPREF0321_2511 [Dermacoccus sp. Ellin185]|nr:hypothetical protein HMPREF0321_2511 [Dermacoccus sp. Ellin185]
MLRLDSLWRFLWPGPGGPVSLRHAGRPRCDVVRPAGSGTRRDWSARLPARPGGPRSVRHAGRPRCDVVRPAQSGTCRCWPARKLAGPVSAHSGLILFGASSGSARGASLGATRGPSTLRRGTALVAVAVSTVRRAQLRFTVTFAIPAHLRDRRPPVRITSTFGQTERTRRQSGNERPRGRQDARRGPGRARGHV